MKDKMVLKKICNIYASDLHFATKVFPFVTKELESGNMIKTILEKDEQENIEKVLQNIGLNSEIKKKISNIDWTHTNISKIKEIFKLLEEDTNSEKEVNLIVCGRNIFIEKVNKAIDLWVKNNIEKLEKRGVKINVINSYSFEENKDTTNIVDAYEYILKTIGIEKTSFEELLKAN